MIWAKRGYRPQCDAPTPEKTTPKNSRARGGYIGPLGLSLPRGGESAGAGGACSSLVRGCTNAPPRPCTFAEHSRHSTPSPHPNQLHTAHCMGIYSIVSHSSSRAQGLCVSVHWLWPVCLLLPPCWQTRANMCTHTYASALFGAKNQTVCTMDHF